MAKMVNDMLFLAQADNNQLIPETMGELTVENPGMPVPQEPLPRFFDWFHRVAPSRKKRKREGSGIGLAIVKSIIEAYNGEISVTSDAVSTCC